MDAQHNLSRWGPLRGSAKVKRCHSGPIWMVLQQNLAVSKLFSMIIHVCLHMFAHENSCEGHRNCSPQPRFSRRSRGTSLTQTAPKEEKRGVPLDVGRTRMTLCLGGSTWMPLPLARVAAARRHLSGFRIQFRAFLYRYYIDLGRQKSANRRVLRVGGSELLVLSAWEDEWRPGYLSLG